MIKILFCPVKFNEAQLSSLASSAYYDDSQRALLPSYNYPSAKEGERNEVARNIVEGWLRIGGEPVQTAIAVWGALSPPLRYWLFSHNVPPQQGEVCVWVYEPASLALTPIPWVLTGLYHLKLADIRRSCYEGELRSLVEPVESDPNEILEFIKVKPVGGDAYILPRSGIGAGITAELEDLSTDNPSSCEYKFELLTMTRREADAIPEL